MEFSDIRRYAPGDDVKKSIGKLVLDREKPI